MPREKLSVTEFNGQMIKGALEAKKVLKKYTVIPPLSKLKLSVSQSGTVETGGGLKVFVGFKFDKKKKYEVVQEYEYGFPDEENSAIALNDDAQTLFSPFGTENPGYGIALDTGIDETKTIDSLFGINAETIDEELEDAWVLQSYNLALSFAGDLVRFVNVAYQQYVEYGVSLESLKYKAVLTLERSTEFGFELSFFEVATFEGARKYTKGIIHTIEVSFDDD